jgi:hypothetical protein
MPSMLTSAAFWVLQVMVADWPFCTLSGLTEIVAVGCGGGGGGGGGVGATFFLQAPPTSMSANASISTNHFVLRFTSSSMRENSRMIETHEKVSNSPPKSALSKTNAKKFSAYLAPQFGCELTPEVVS